MPAGYTPGSIDVFVSYADQDKLAAKAVVEGLRGSGISCWFAPDSFMVGESYERAIMRALNACRCVVLIFSAAAAKSAHVEREIRRAAKLGRIVTPFRLEDEPFSEVQQYYLGGAQWFDAFQPPLEEPIRQLGEAVIRLLQALPRDPAPPSR